LLERISVCLSFERSSFARIIRIRQSPMLQKAFSEFTVNLGYSRDDEQTWFPRALLTEKKHYWEFGILNCRAHFMYP
jgi:hypothetical protein